LHVDGADSIALAPDGDLIVKTAAGDVVEKAPVIYQEIGGAPTIPEQVNLSGLE
jgi:hypothetical protein